MSRQIFTDLYGQGTPDVIGQTKFALEVTKAVLPLYEQVFNVEYPLPKLDTLVVRQRVCARCCVYAHYYLCIGT